MGKEDAWFHFLVVSVQQLAGEEPGSLRAAHHGVAEWGCSSWEGVCTYRENIPSKQRDITWQIKTNMTGREKDHRRKEKALYFSAFNAFSSAF